MPNTTAVKSTDVPVMQVGKKAHKVMRERHYLHELSPGVFETPDQLAWRVANAITVNEGIDQEKWARRIHDLIAQQRFCPNTPCMTNAGTARGQLCACFVLGIEDSMDSIFTAVRRTALIQKSGGGTGFSFDGLRPEGSRVGDSFGVASGPLSFIHVFNSATEAIKQGASRRGANMGCLSVMHKDIVQFILSKDVEGTLSNFNISVKLTDEFMDAVIAGVTSMAVSDNFGNDFEINPVELFLLIVKQAWKNGEPGVLFIDAINRANTTPDLGRIESTNPCVVASSILSTPNGLFTFGEMVGKDSIGAVVDKRSFSAQLGTTRVSCLPVRLTGNQEEVFDVRLDTGQLLRCNGHHEFIIPGRDREKVKLEDLSVDTTVMIQSSQGGFGSIGSTSEGLLLANHGTLVDAGTKLEMEVPVELAYLFLQMMRDYGEDILDADTEFALPNIVKRGSRQLVAGYLHEIFHNISGTADKCSVLTLPGSENFLRGIQLLLLQFGIVARIAQRSKRARWVLRLSGENLKKFLELEDETRKLTGDPPGEYWDRLRKLRKWVEAHSIHSEDYTAKIVAIEPAGKEDVYCLEVPGVNSIIVNGIVTGNCGETPLYPNESCDLGSMNLAAYDLATEAGIKQLCQDVKIAVRALDNILDVSTYPLEDITNAVVRTRKIGLGVMGVADTLIRNNLAYDSEAGRSFIEKIYSRMTRAAEEASEELGRERGIPEACAHLGRRNATVTCVAPTGTISFAMEASSGIEPIFSLQYVKHLHGGDDLVVVNEVLMKRLQTLGLSEDQMAIVRTELAKSGSIQSLTFLPQDLKDVFKTASEIAWEDHVRMQAVFQKYTHLAVSKTINMPNNATVEDVANLYRMAYNLRLKGITMYRAGSRHTEVMSAGTQAPASENTSVCSDKKKYVRPSRLSGATWKMNTGCGNLYVTLNEDSENNQIECFLCLGKAGNCGQAHLQSVAKMLTVALRNGTDPVEIIDMLRGIRCNMPAIGPDGPILSCADAIAKALQQELGMEDVHELGSTLGVGPCPDCGAQMIAQSGCTACPDCGWSKCG